jgi:pyruvate/2-oxoglutarate/acetoin dehydrogenase E1 component|tara:strand:- start:27 stop:269 length:243 start_codon:yes stop_codon:yes gene_type:complete
MAKVISAVEAAAAEATKMVSIKHTRVMQNANGNDVTVLDYEEQKDVDMAIADAEAKKANLEAELVDVEAELVEYQAIKDA